MYTYKQHYINGAWVDSEGGNVHRTINPATEAVCSEVVLGTQADVDKAVAAARAAFAEHYADSKETRIDMVKRIMAEYEKRIPDIAKAISTEMGCPISMASTAQAGSGMGHLGATLAALSEFETEVSTGTNKVVFEPIGVVALITPWNWPMNQTVAKVAPALAAGNAVILKPSEETPATGAIFAEVMAAAGVPAGLFNLVQGDGPTVGQALAAHEGVDMVSFTGSTRAGVLVAKAAAESVKRVHQELGGKSPAIVLEGTPLDKALPPILGGLLLNSGQSCVAPTRLLVHESQHDEALKMIADIMNSKNVGDPAQEGDHIGPVVNKAQWEKIQGLIQQGIDDGATLAAGGTGLPEGLSKGFYVKPTVFGNVKNTMAIAREEIFGPVLVVIPYKNDDEAISIANDTEYGLGAYLLGDPERAKKMVPLIRAGSIFVNAGGLDFNSPFGGYKKSGNGREFGKFGLEEFMEKKSVIGSV